MSLPKDPIILLSYVNTKLRDYYSTLGDFCVSEDIDENELKESLQRSDIPMIWQKIHLFMGIWRNN